MPRCRTDDNIFRLLMQPIRASRQFCVVVRVSSNPLNAVNSLDVAARLITKRFGSRVTRSKAVTNTIQHGFGFALCQGKACLSDYHWKGANNHNSPIMGSDTPAG